MGNSVNICKMSDFLCVNLRSAGAFSVRVCEFWLLRLEQRRRPTRQGHQARAKRPQQQHHRRRQQGLRPGRGKLARSFKGAPPGCGPLLQLATAGQGNSLKLFRKTSLHDGMGNSVRL